MNKGKRITIQLESVGIGGVVTTTVMAAVVAYSSGDNITVRAADGYIYEIDANIRNDDGAYIVRITI